MVLYTAVGTAKFSQVGVGALYVIGMQAPTENTDLTSPCLIRSLTATSKVTLLALLQLSVGLAMVLVYAVVELVLGRACCRRGSSIRTVPVLVGMEYSHEGQATNMDTPAPQPAHPRPHTVYSALSSPLDVTVVTTMASPSDVRVPGSAFNFTESEHEAEGVGVEVGPGPGAGVGLPHTHVRSRDGSIVMPAAGDADSPGPAPVSGVEGNDHQLPSAADVDATVSVGIDASGAACGSSDHMDVYKDQHDVEEALPVVADNLPVPAAVTSLVAPVRQLASAAHGGTALVTRPDALTLTQSAGGVQVIASTGTQSEALDARENQAAPLLPLHHDRPRPSGVAVTGQAVTGVAMGGNPPAPGDRGARGEPLAVSELTQRALLVSAAVNFGLTAYATLTVACVKMLHCVWVPGTPRSELRLFIRGSVVCDYGGWQAGLLVLVTLLAAAPLGVAWLAAWSRRGVGPSDVGSHLKRDVRLGLRRALVDSYKKGAYFWEAVLMGQRLVRVVTASGALHPLQVPHHPFLLFASLSSPAVGASRRGGRRGGGMLCVSLSSAAQASLQCLHAWHCWPQVGPQLSDMPRTPCVLPCTLQWVVSGSTSTYSLTREMSHTHTLSATGPQCYTHGPSPPTPHPSPPPQAPSHPHST
jgi:hypothetical protein